MVKKNFNVTADIKHTLSNNMFEVVSGDTGNTVTITVTDGSAPVDLAGCRVIVLFRSNGGTAMQDSAEDNSGITFDSEICNRVTVELFPASYSPGMVECELQIYSGEDMGLLITTSMFNFKCRASLLCEDTLNAAPEYPLLIRLIKQCSEIAAAEEERKLLAAKFEGMTVSASSLSPGSSPSADICEKDNVKHISFGIPEGRPGITPHIGDNGNWWLGQQDTGVSAVNNPHNPDWSQNDSAADDYIKNRTHWKEESEPEILLPETTVTIDSEAGAAMLAEPINLVSGSEYIIAWNGAEYTCKAFAAAADGGISCVVLGNPVVMDADDTGEPFAIVELGPEGQSIIGVAVLAFALDESTNPTVSISGQSVTYHKLDSNYLDLDWLPLQKMIRKDPYTLVLNADIPFNYFYDDAFLFSLLSCSYINVTLDNTDGVIERTCQRIDAADGVEFECDAFKIWSGGNHEYNAPIEGGITLKQYPSSPVIVTITPYVNTNKIPHGFLPKFPMIGLKASEPVDDQYVERDYHLMIKDKALILINEQENQYREIGFSPQKIGIELFPGYWNNNSQSFQSSGLNDSNFVMVAPATGYETMWQECGMKYTLQENDTLQFTCETVPSERIGVRIMIFQW